MDDEWPLPKDRIAHLWQADLDHDDFGPATLSRDEADRAGRFRFPVHQDRFTRGRTFLRRLAAGYLRCNPREIRFSYGPAGKPVLLHPDAVPLHFNVAHSEATILIAFSCDAEVGVDVEVRRTLPDEADLVERFFHPDEIASYRALPPQLRSHGFLNAWTRKEAVLKACGEGLQGALDSFAVTLEPDRPCQLLLPPSRAQGTEEWTLIAPELGSDLAAALAGRTALRAVRIQRFGATSSILHRIA